MVFYWKDDPDTLKWREAHGDVRPRRLSVAELEEALGHIASHAALSPYAEELCRRAGGAYMIEYAVTHEEKGKRKVLERALKELGILGMR